MALLTILEYPDPRLRTRAEPVERVDSRIRKLTEDLLETMYAAKGIGLAATQVDDHRRVLVADVSEDHHQPVILVNPVIRQRDGVEAMEEGCLSVPGIYEKIERADRIRVEAWDRDGNDIEIETGGLLAVCIQHEIDHLDGKLFVDYLSELKRQRIRKRLAKERRQRAAGVSDTRRPATPVI